MGGASVGAAVGAAVGAVVDSGVGVGWVLALASAWVLASVCRGLGRGCRRGRRLGRRTRRGTGARIGRRRHGPGEGDGDPALAVGEVQGGAARLDQGGPLERLEERGLLLHDGLVAGQTGGGKPGDPHDRAVGPVGAAEGVAAGEPADGADPEHDVELGVGQDRDHGARRHAVGVDGPLAQQRVPRRGVEDQERAFADGAEDGQRVAVHGVEPARLQQREELGLEGHGGLVAGHERRRRLRDQERPAARPGTARRTVLQPEKPLTRRASKLASA